MNLRDLREILTTTDAWQWSRIDSTGPLYRNGYVVSGGLGPDAEHDINIYWHDSAAVYRDDIDLTIQWGMNLSPVREDRDAWHLPWAEKFPSRSVHPHWVDVFWRGTLVDRYAMVSIDGGHGLVPFPHTKAKSDPLDHDTKYDYVISERELGIARLIDSLQGGIYRVDEHVARCGLVVTQDED